MFYWLYTELQPVLSSLLMPLLCLTVVLPPLLAYKLGRGIQRSAKADQLSVAGSKRWLTLATFLVVILAVLTLLLTITKDKALSPRRGKQPTGEFQLWLAGGPASIDKNTLLKMGLVQFFALLGTCIVLREGIRNGGWLREKMDRLLRPSAKRGEMGSAQFCSHREFRRYRKYDSEGFALYGAYWGRDRIRLDIGYGRFCLNGEDAARGVLTIGGPGSGKTAGVILPVIADRMQAGHSLIVADPQGEITSKVLEYAKSTGHLVIIHDPTSTQNTARYNLAAGIDNVSDARAIANVLIPAQSGDNKFWSDSATALLAACLINFDNLGDIYSSLSDLKKLAEVFVKTPGDAALLANSFIASVNSDGKVASNVVATLATALTGWADSVTRANTGSSDFNAESIVAQSVVVMLTCPGRMREVYASYLGATLRKLMLDLDTIGEQSRDPKRPGALPKPVGIILDEFPTLGKLDSLVADVNLVRKRRISILIGAQSKGQFHRLYGPDGTQSLFTGMATQIIYAGCDYETAKFYSEASGVSTVDANPDPTKSNLRQRPLLTPDEVIRPQDGNCTVFARYVTADFGTQVVFNARLTRLYERDDWNQRLAANKHLEAFILRRSRSATLNPVNTTSVSPDSVPLSVPVDQPTVVFDLEIPSVASVGYDATTAPKDEVDLIMDKVAANAPTKRGFSPNKYPHAMRAKREKRS